MKLTSYLQEGVDLQSSAVEILKSGGKVFDSKGNPIVSEFQIWAANEKDIEQLE